MSLHTRSLLGFLINGGSRNITKRTNITQALTVCTQSNGGSNNLGLQPLLQKLINSTRKRGTLSKEYVKV